MTTPTPTPKPSGTTRRFHHADRVGLPSWLVLAVAVLCALACGAAGFTAARARISPAAGASAGLVVALLLVLGMPSLSLRLVSRVLLVASAAVLVRYGVLEGSLVDSGQVLALWVVAAAGVFVLTDRIATDASPALGPPPGAPPPDGAEAAAGRGPLATGRLVLVVVLLVGMAAVVLASLVAPRMTRSTESGEGPNLEAAGRGSALRSTEALDMTQRPELTDEVVFTVAADRATFWRGQTFDRWDGRTWTRSEVEFQVLGEGGQVVPAEDDLGAGGSDEVTQRFQIETDYSDVLFAAASAATVDAPGPVVQRADGTLVTRPMGRGASYTVVSRRLPLSEDALRRAEDGTTPREVLARYATPSVVSDRVVAAAEQATAGLTNDYDRVRALEAWMGTQTTYSLDAPLAPQGVDVVDDFLFESRQGWCEQIASSLVVMARSLGMPARLVTGYTPGDRDALTGDFTVRALNAHAWAEVWFPGFGWVPFDPTADVALAGSDQAEDTLLQWLAAHAVYLVIAAVSVALVLGPLRALLRRRRRAARAARGRDRGRTWAVAADRHLDKLGRRVARARGPDETATTYAAALARRYGDDRLREVGRAIDDAVFAPEQPDDERRAAADAVLAEVAAADVPEPEAAGRPSVQ